MKLRWFPVCTDSFDDLVAMEMDDLTEEELKKLGQLSTLVPTLMYWAVVFRHDNVYTELQKMQDDTFKDVCLQLWYPDELTESVIYRESAQYESGSTEAPIVFPVSISDLAASEKRKGETEAIVGLDVFSAMQKGMFVILLIASRHFRTPIPPQFWMRSIAAREMESSEASEEGAR